MGDSINLGVHVFGEDKKQRKPPKMVPTRQSVSDKIQKANVTEDIKEALMERLKEYPDGALPSFLKNLPTLIETLRLKKAKNEL
jgi:hypothetical protein